MVMFTIFYYLWYNGLVSGDGIYDSGAESQTLRYQKCELNKGWYRAIALLGNHSFLLEELLWNVMKI